MQEFYKLLMAYNQLLLIQGIPWATETAMFWQNLWVYPILSVSCELLCILWAIMYQLEQAIILVDFEQGLSTSWL